jgi:DNA-binding transcriptional MocR family regulator
VQLELRVDRTSTRPIYQQIVEQVKNCISEGRLPAGSRLPTVRTLAITLQVTRLTVQHAYAELQSEGWLEATVGRGTFVSATAHTHTFGRGMQPPLTPDGVISEILQVNQAVGLRSMASASPDPSLFPGEEFWSALQGLHTATSELVTYSSSQGDAQLRIEVSRDLGERGIDVGPGEVLIVAGVTQGLALVTQALTQPGDRVLVEQPTYLGLLHTLKLHGVEAIGVPMDDEGVDLAELERAILQRRPRFLYTVPTFQNPTGRCMSLARRTALLDLAALHGLPVVEDDIYGRLSYDMAPPPTLYQLDRHGQVIHVGSYSKVLMPGLRLGYVIPPSRWAEQLLSLRRANDLCSPTVLQRALARFLHSGGLKRHLRRVLPIYRRRRDAMVAALGRHLPELVQWEAPGGGFCCWLTLPGLHAFADVEQAILRQGWAVTPGDVFLSENPAHKSLRVCFGSLPPDSIHIGVETIARAIRARINATPGPSMRANDWTPLV